MLVRLQPGDASRALPLLAGKPHLLLLEAVIAGTAPGYVLVDNTDRPRALFAAGPEGHYLVGDPKVPGFYLSLKQHVRQVLIPRAYAEEWWYATVYYELGWRRVITWLFGPDGDQPQAPLHTRQRYFAGAPAREGPDLPEGYALLPVDAATLSRTDLAGVERLSGYVCGDYASREDYIHYGFGVCLARGHELLGWSTTDCVVGQRAEIGIMMGGGHRRQGHGTLVARAMLAECARRGITRVGWHCFEQNVASAATALRAGLPEGEPHALAQHWISVVDGYLVHGNQALLHGHFDLAAWYYESGLDLARRSGARSMSHLIPDTASRDLYGELHRLSSALATRPTESATLLADLVNRLRGTSFQQAGY
jgi:hypothetical protein